MKQAVKCQSAPNILWLDFEPNEQFHSQASNYISKDFIDLLQNCCWSWFLWADTVALTTEDVLLDSSPSANRNQEQIVKLFIIMDAF